VKDREGFRERTPPDSTLDGFRQLEFPPHGITVHRPAKQLGDEIAKGLHSRDLFHDQSRAMSGQPALSMRSHEQGLGFRVQHCEERAALGDVERDELIVCRWRLDLANESNFVTPDPRYTLGSRETDPWHTPRHFWPS
jgi:hypothetical protein